MPISGTDPALTEARVGMMRVGGSRVGYVLPIPAVTINGTVRTSNVRIDGLSVSDILNGTPNTATMRVSGFTPTEGHEVIVAFGTGPIQFRGRILSTDKIYELKPANLAFDCQCISEEWLLNRRKVTKRYLSQSATAIIQDIFTNFTAGFSAAGVASGLPSLDEITFTNEDVTDCLDRICRRIGEDWQLDYAKVLHVPAADGWSANAITDTADHGMSGIAVHTDLSQLKTRQSGEGGGSVASSDVAVGQTTIPVDDGSWYTTGMVKSGPQVITYTGVDLGGGGAIVGALLSPTNAPTVTVQQGTGIDPGAHDYAVTFYDGTGETTPGPTASMTAVAAISAPSAIGTRSSASGDGNSSLTGNGTLKWAFTFKRISDGAETSLSPEASATGDWSNGGANDVYVTIALSGSSSPPAGYVRQWYRTVLDGSTFKRVPQDATEIDSLGIFQGTETAGGNFVDHCADGSLGANAPASNGTGLSAAGLSNIPRGPSGTTGRRVHRTPADDAQLKLLVDIPNNTATTHADTAADSSLGANVPTANTSGLTSDHGTVLAGSTDFLVTSTAPFLAGGGWAVAGTQYIRYGGVSGSSLTGIPSTGPGALTSPLNYGTEIVLVPMLTGIPSSGVGSVLYAINPGEDVNIWVTRNDTAAQTFMAAAVGGDGIHEADVIQDRRMSETEITARCDAKLEELSTPLVTVRYLTRDITTQSGRDVTITLSAPTSISGTFRIQSVTTTRFAPVSLATQHGEVADYRPLRQVECSSRRLSFEQILRLIRKAD